MHYYFKMIKFTLNYDLNMSKKIIVILKYILIFYSISIILKWKISGFFFIIKNTNYYFYLILKMNYYAELILKSLIYARLHFPFCLGWIVFKFILTNNIWLI